MRIEKHEPSGADGHITGRLGGRHGTGWFGLAAGILVALWPSGQAIAVSARPGPIDAAQPDGTRITVYLRGDERTHWYEDPDGYVVTKVPETGRWVYAIKDQDPGKIRPTNLIVGEDSPAGVESLANTAKQLRAAAVARRRAEAIAPMQKAGAQGTLLNLVILVNFTDLAIDDSRQAFEDLFNQIGYSADWAFGSVKDYYREVSYLSLTIESTVVEPVTLDHDYAYYGRNDVWGEDLLPTTMVRDAVDKLEQRGFDFSQMDGDSDGHIDALTIVHAGEGEEIGNDPNAIWSHMSVLGNPVTYDGVIIQPYVAVPAVRETGRGITRIGVICHELGHHLGLPDLYDTDGSSLGAGDFCLMAGGNWNGDGYGSCPAHFSGWCKIKLDWVSPAVISVTGTYTLGQLKSTAQVYKLQGSFQANEYFLIENRQGVGFDAYLPGSQRGILIWHIDDNVATNDDEGQTVSRHYKVDLEEASTSDSTKQHLEANKNGGNDDDYFRASNKDHFTDGTTPSAKGYNKSPCGLGIINISDSGPNMTFQLAVVTPMAISGYVRNADGAGIDGVLITEDENGGWDMTDTDGFYRIPVRYGWSGTITPRKNGYAFDPAGRDYENVRNDLAGQDYTGQMVQDPNDPNVPPGETGALSVETVDKDGLAVGGPIYVDGVFSGTGAWSGMMTVGLHVVGFGDLDGYTAPDDELVSVQKDQTTAVTGVYTEGASDPDELTVSVIADPDVIEAGESSLVIALVDGGVPPYEYAWAHGVTAPSFIALPNASTTYTVTVADAEGTMVEGSTTILVSGGPLTVTVQADPNSVVLGNSSTVTATASGGVRPYTYSWTMGATEASISVSPDKPTVYLVTVTDAIGQATTGSATVNVTQVAGVTEEGGGPCMASMAPLAAMFIAVVAWTAGGARRSRRRA